MPALRSPCSLTCRPLKTWRSTTGILRYRDRCIDFMQMYGWEVRDLNHPAWWAPLPDDIRSRVHFYNVPVEDA